MVNFALNQINRLYVWGGKGSLLWTPHGLLRHRWCHPVYDCSGLIMCAFFHATATDLRAHWSAQTIFEDGGVSTTPTLGTVACYGKPGKCTHVMMHVGDGIVVGASGGDSDVLSPRDAKARERESKARGGRLSVRVHSFPTVHYRTDFQGWRELPFPKE